MTMLRGPFLLLTFACLAGTGCDKKKKTGPVATRESERQRTESVQAAYIDGDPAGSKVVPRDSGDFKAIDAVLADLGKAARAKDRAAFFSLLSPGAMVTHLESAGMTTFRNDRERKDMAAGLETGMARSYGGLAFDRHQLVRLERIAPGQLLAFTRVYDDDLSAVSKLRWWLVEEAGAWKIYDFEDLDQELRTSTLMGTMLSGLSGAKRPWVDPFVKFVRDFGSDPVGLLEKLEEVRQQADAIIRENPPAEIEAFLRRTVIGALLGSGEHEQALEEIGRVEKVQSDSPILDYFRGSALTGLEKYPEALAAYEAYAAELGWDRDLHEVVADCLMAAGDREKALDHALKGLAEHADSPGCLATAAVAAGADRAGELKKHFDAASDPESAYETAIDHALELEEETTAKAVFALMKEHCPDSELIEIYEDIFSDEEAEDDE